MASDNAKTEVEGVEPPLSAEVLKRVDALSELQTQHDDLGKAYEEEKRQLELKYLAQYAPLYAKRSAIIKGDVDPAASTASKGIPGFWLKAFQNHPRVTEYIEEQDCDALEHLQDVTVETAEDLKSFKLVFTFTENEFFTNTTLTKTFVVSNLLAGSSLELDKAEGCDIDWKEGKDLTVKLVKKVIKKGKGRAKTVTKSEPIPSFFRFFDSPEIPDMEDPEVAAGMTEEEAIALMEQVQAEFGVGFALRNKIIPNAVNWFTGSAVDEDEEGDDDDDEYDDEDEDGDDDDEEEDDAPELEEIDDEEEDVAKPRRGGKGGKGRGGGGGGGGRGKRGGGGGGDEDDGEASDALNNAFAKAGLEKGGAEGGEKAAECKQQ